MIKAVLFDFDGVVVNSMPQHLVAWKYAFKKYGFDFEDFDFLKREGRGVEALVTDLVREKGIDTGLVPQLMKHKIEYYDRHLNLEFYDGFLDTLEMLKSKQIRMAIVTGGSRNRVEYVIQKHLDGYFELTVTADDVKETKPSPEPYIKAAALLGLDKNKCLILENAPLGIEAARKAGITVVAIETTLPKSYLNEANDIVTSFAEFQTLLENKYGL